MATALVYGSEVLVAHDVLSTLNLHDTVVTAGVYFFGFPAVRLGPDCESEQAC